MSYQVIIRPEAGFDIEEAFEWYENRNLGLGSEFVRAVDACFSAIGRNPLAYPVIYRQTHRQIRRILVRKFPYRVLYFIEQDIIVIIACFHIKRDSQRWQDRLE